ncbi:hypothetical protein Tco_0307147 [Tanacetum coccineum]
MQTVSDKLALVQSTIATNSQDVQDLKTMFTDMVSLLKTAEVFKKANAEGEKGRHYGECSGGATTSSRIIKCRTSPFVNEENALDLHASVEKSSEENTSEKNASDDEPPVKKLKFLIPTSSSILSPTPLKSIVPEPIQKPDTTKMTIEQFTEHLFKTTSSIFSTTPPRELM